MRSFLLIPLIAAACVPAPKKDYAPEEIAKIDAVAEIMHVQAHYADPVFGKRDQASFSDDELAQMAKAAEMLDATSTRLQSFVGQGAFDEGFGKFAQQLNGNAKALREGAEKKDAKAVSAALSDMKSTCSSCHGVYR